MDLSAQTAEQKYDDQVFTRCPKVPSYNRLQNFALPPYLRFSVLIFGPKREVNENFVRLRFQPEDLNSVFKFKGIRKINGRICIRYGNKNLFAVQ
jgi:hypothetical protein